MLILDFLEKIGKDCVVRVKLDMVHLFIPLIAPEVPEVRTVTQLFRLLGINL